MKKTICHLLGIVLAGSLMVGCANATNEDIGTAVGGGAGALIGYGINSSNATGAIIGGAAGALLGREVGRRADY